jgi:hypothetical protein
MKAKNFISCAASFASCGSETTGHTYYCAYATFFSVEVSHTNQPLIAQEDLFLTRGRSILCSRFRGMKPVHRHNHTCPN